MDAEGRAMQEQLPRTTKLQNFRLVIDKFSFPQNRSLNLEDWYKSTVIIFRHNFKYCYWTVTSIT